MARQYGYSASYTTKIFVDFAILLWSSIITPICSHKEIIWRKIPILILEFRKLKGVSTFQTCLSYKLFSTPTIKRQLISPNMTIFDTNIYFLSACFLNMRFCLFCFVRPKKIDGVFRIPQFLGHLSGNSWWNVRALVYPSCTDLHEKCFDIPLMSYYLKFWIS